MRVVLGTGHEKREVNSTEDGADSGSALSLADVLQMLKRHIIFIIASLLICISASLLYIKHATRIFEATASIRIDPSRAGSLGLNDLGAAQLGHHPRVVVKFPLGRRVENAVPRQRLEPLAFVDGTRGAHYCVRVRDRIRAVIGALNHARREA